MKRRVGTLISFPTEIMRTTVLLAVLACSCEAWRVPAASAHATARRSQRTPPLTPRRSALLMSEDDTDMAEAAQPSTVRCFLAHHVTRHATPHEYATPPRTAPCTVPRTMPCTMPRTTHRAPHATHQAPKGGQGGMPTDFLGFLDVNTTFGSIAASLIVAGGFCVLVELVKFVDKSPSTPSVFGSLWS